MRPLDLFCSTLALLLFSAGTACALSLRDETFATNGVGRVVFSHNAHIRQKGVGNNCTACHDAIFDMRKRVRATMADMAKGKSCGACHDGEKAFPLSRCTACHPTRELTYQVRQTGTVRFSHRLHTRKATCTACHDRLYRVGHNNRVGMARMKQGKSCGACHDGRKAFPISRCTGCHPVRDVKFAERSAGDVTFSHKAHLAMYGCGECHPAIYRPGNAPRGVTMAEMRKGKSCGACHDGKTAFAARGECDRCHAS